MRLEDVVGQEQVTKPLSQSVKSGKVSHAYLFIGPRGCGKTSVARILAHELNGFKYELEDYYVDIIEIDGASNRGIDNIRELREKVAIAPTSGKYKVYIIDEVHMLTREAFNALLKTLEEPPEHAVFIMATTDPYKIPVTITSRAQTYTFKLVDTKIMLDYLKKICKKEKIKINDDALEVIVKRGGGSFRDSLSILDQISTLSNDLITKEQVISALGLPNDENIANLFNAYLSRDLNNINNILKEILSSGIKADVLVEEMIAYIIDNTKPELINLLAKLAEIKAPFAEAKLLVALAGESYSSPTTTMQPSPKIIPKEVVNFDWYQFLDKVRSLNDAVYYQLKDVGYELHGNRLELFPKKRSHITILGRERNLALLKDASDGLDVILRELGDRPSHEKDVLISKISGIMGGEVENDDGGNPFK